MWTAFARAESLLGFTAWICLGRQSQSGRVSFQELSHVCSVSSYRRCWQKASFQAISLDVKLMASHDVTILDGCVELLRMALSLLTWTMLNCWQQRLLMFLCVPEVGGRKRTVAFRFEAASRRNNCGWAAVQPAGGCFTICPSEVSLQANGWHWQFSHAYLKPDMGELRAFVAKLLHAFTCYYVRCLVSS